MVYLRTALDEQILQTEVMMQNMEDGGMPMVMQSRDDAMEELREGLADEGMSDEEIDAWMNRAHDGDAAGAEEVAMDEGPVDEASKSRLLEEEGTGGYGNRVGMKGGNDYDL